MRRKSKSKTVVVFDENSRREFLTGFHKRKLERKKKCQEKFEARLKEAKKKIREKARETLRKYVNANTVIEDSTTTFEDNYELENHTVKIQELLAEDIANKNNWIGPNKMNWIDTAKESQVPSRLDNRIEGVPEMSVTSLKQMKKLIADQSRTIIQNDKVFQKKNRLEKMKNKKRAARKRRRLEKERKQLKGRSKKK